MKLDIKKTVFIGCGFLTIMMLWQVYNYMIPIYLDGFLKEIFGGAELLIGIVMALDNLFALFMIKASCEFSFPIHRPVVAFSEEKSAFIKASK